MIRDMKTEDLVEVLEVRTSTIENAISYETLEAYGITVESLTESIQTHAKGWVYEIEGKIVGFTMGNKDNGEIEVLAVLPNFEGRGIGSSLLEEAVRWLAREGHREIWLKTTPDDSIRAYGFYQQLGWQPTGELEGEDEILTLAIDLE